MSHILPDRLRKWWKNNPEAIKKATERIRKYSGSMEKCPAWRGGISFEPYGIEFNDKLKKEIKQRDGFKCRECGVTSLEDRLVIHQA